MNAKKSFFAKTELEHLGHWITREGVKPLPDKAKAILALDAPRNRRELRSFIRIVNYYQDMCVERTVYWLAYLLIVLSCIAYYSYPFGVMVFLTLKK